MCIFALIIAARLLLRADVVLVRLLISIRMDYFVFGVVSNKLSMKHQKLKAGKWKLGGYETGITIKANLSFTFCTPGKNVPEQVHCVFWYWEQRRILALEHFICKQYYRLTSYPWVWDVFWDCICSVCHTRSEDGAGLRSHSWKLLDLNLLVDSGPSVWSFYVLAVLVRVPSGATVFPLQPEDMCARWV